MTPPKPVRRGTLALLSLLLGGLQAAHASAQGGAVAGNYEPSPQRMEVKVSTWGEDCGTRPVDQVINETGKVSVKEEGAHLSMKFSTRTLRSNGCWSQNPSLTLVSATSANGKYRAECRTAAGDPKREIGRYTVTVGTGVLELVEESDYDWQLKSSHCVAKVRVVQTLTSLARPRQAAEPAKIDASVARPAVTPPAALADDEKCAPGPAARLRIRPVDARIAPGERVCFVIRAVDAAGCPLAATESTLELSLQRPNGVHGTLTGNCFKAAENAALAEGVFKVQAAGSGLRAEATVVVASPDLSDITARRGASAANTGNTGGRSAEAQYETGVRAVAKSSNDTVWLGAGVATLALLLAFCAVLALRAAKKQKAAPHARRRSNFPEPELRLSDAETLDRPAPASAPARARQANAALVAATGPQRICPRCRRGYPPGSERCTVDGEMLVDYDDFVAGQVPRAASRFCPECGAALAPDAFFCGACGHKMTAQ